MAQDALEAVKKKARLSWLLSFYGSMLTENQLEMARLHWEEDLSLAEIAAQFSVTRQSVHDTVGRTERQLEALEEKLGLLRRFRIVEEGLTACREELKRVEATEETLPHLLAARRAIESLLDQEEE